MLSPPPSAASNRYRRPSLAPLLPYALLPLSGCPSAPSVGHHPHLGHHRHREAHILSSPLPSHCHTHAHTSSQKFLHPLPGRTRHPVTPSPHPPSCKVPCSEPAPPPHHLSHTCVDFPHSSPTHVPCAHTCLTHGRVPDRHASLSNSCVCVTHMHVCHTCVYLTCMSISHASHTCLLHSWSNGAPHTDSCAQSPITPTSQSHAPLTPHLCGYSPPCYPEFAGSQRRAGGSLLAGAPLPLDWEAVGAPGGASPPLITPCTPPFPHPTLLSSRALSLHEDQHGYKVTALGVSQQVSL